MIFAETSKKQKWGVGQKEKKNPKPVHETDYPKKMKTDRVLVFDPRPENSRRTSNKEKDFFLRNLQEAKLNTMWEKLLVFHYQNYELSSDREEVLRENVGQVISNFKKAVQQHFLNDLSNSVSVHVSGTESQSASKLWHQMRFLRITASTVKDFISNPNLFASKMWEFQNFGNIPAIRWGRDNENKALQVI